MTQIARILAPVLLAAALGGCTIIPSPTIGEMRPAAEGTAVPLGQAVAVGVLTAAPLRIVEDSRCPINARCVWAGRLVIEANIARAGSTAIVRLTLGEPAMALDAALALTSGNPAPETGRTIAPEDYRFTFAPR